MTTQDAMLKLARAVYGESAYLNDTDLREGCQGVFVQCRAMWGKFDPANNDSQAVAVLLWLLSHDTCNELYRDGIVFYPSQSRFVEPVRIEHDNTPASFRAAVTKAALRVVG